MTVKKLRELLDGLDDDFRVTISCETPDGWVCPDGCTVDLNTAYRGFDWHGHEFVLIPEKRLIYTKKEIDKLMESHRYKDDSSGA